MHLSRTSSKYDFLCVVNPVGEKVSKNVIPALNLLSEIIAYDKKNQGLSSI